MTVDFEDRIARLEQQADLQQHSKHARWKLTRKATVLIGMSIVAGSLLVAGHLWSPWQPSAIMLPPMVASQAKYTVYFFDKPIPQGFVLDKKSVVYDNGILSTTLNNANGSIFIVQQAAPKQQIKLDNLPGFKPLGSSLGRGVIGVVGGKQTVILMTDTTLVNVTADPNIGAPVLTEIMRSLTPLSD